MVEVMDDSRKVNYTGKHVLGRHCFIIVIYALKFSSYLGKGSFSVDNTN